MGTNRENVRRWLKEGKRQGATHTIVVCDTFDHQDYPVHVTQRESVTLKVREYQAGKHSMQRVMEVYSHALDHESQLKEHCSMHLE